LLGCCRGALGSLDGREIRIKPALLRALLGLWLIERCPLARPLLRLHQHG